MQNTSRVFILGAKPRGIQTSHSNKFLQKIIEETGPLVAPSANPEGLKPAETISEAKKYFGQNVDFYASAGKRLSGQPSTLIRLKNGKIDILGQGKDYDKLRPIQRS